VEINDSHTCVFCNHVHSDPGLVTINCNLNGDNHEFKPAGDVVLLGQIIDGKAVVSLLEDLTGDEIALLMAAFMDRISTFEHIKEDPSVIMNALMKGMSGNG
jgi:hypothetical protein